MSDSIACFSDFYEIKVFPLLHQQKIKVKIEGDRDSNDHILATKYVKPQYLITAHQSNKLKVWNMKTGKYLMYEKPFSNPEIDFSTYICKPYNLFYHHRAPEDQ